jgi:hypothetical protein
VKMIDYVDKDYVIVAGQRLERPDWCSRSQWLEFWNIEELDEHRHRQFHGSSGYWRYVTTEQRNDD